MKLEIRNPKSEIRRPNSRALLFRFDWVALRSLCPVAAISVFGFRPSDFGLRVCILLLASAFLAVCPLSAQDAVPANDNAAMEAEALIISNALYMAGELGVTNEPGTNQPMQTEPADEVIDTNEPNNALVAPAPGESRRQWLLRQRAGKGGSAGEPVAGGSQTNGPASADFVPVRPAFSAFARITENNIFDPNRRPHVRNSNVVKSSSIPSESFALVGVMSYEKGTFAFFDGSSSSYQKALKLDDSIAGYKVAHITPDAVELAAGTNQLLLRVGMKLRRESGGAWQMGGPSDASASSSSPTTTGSSAAAASSTNPSQTAAGGAENDVLERLRKKREQE